MLYIVLFDVIAVIMVSKYTDEGFSSSVENNLLLSLKEKYGVSSIDFEIHWNDLQESAQCCGVTSYADWFGSAWADEVNATTPASVYALPLSCRYDNLPQGSCYAISGVPHHPRYSPLLLRHYRITYACDQEAQTTGELDYIYAYPCAPIYIILLSEDMRATMVIAIAISVLDFVLILALASIAFKLPFQRRVHIYDVQQS